MPLPLVAMILSDAASTALPRAEAAALPSGESATPRETAPEPSRTARDHAAGAESLRLSRPVASGYLTSSFGLRSDPIDGQVHAHQGLDIAAPLGTPVVAAADGIVSFAGVAGGYGQLVQIDRPDGVRIRYGHLSRILATPGMAVRSGDLIGTMGSTGRSTGSHLHFEVRLDGRPIDPRQPLPVAEGMTAASDAPAVPARWQGFRDTADRLPAAYR